MKRELTVLVDTREQKPLPIPTHITLLDPNTVARGVTVRVHTVRTTLKTGDYLLAGHESATMIERKGSLAEICGNCLTKDRPRFLRCLKRMRDACSYPILFLEGTPSELARARVPKLKVDAVLGLDALIRYCRQYGVHLQMVPAKTPAARRAAGELIVRQLVAGALYAPRSVHEHAECES